MYPSRSGIVPPSSSLTRAAQARLYRATGSADQGEPLPRDRGGRLVAAKVPGHRADEVPAIEGEQLTPPGYKARAPEDALEAAGLAEAGPRSEPLSGGGWDSNPRNALRRSTAFETVTVSGKCLQNGTSVEPREHERERNPRTRQRAPEEGAGNVATETQPRAVHGLRSVCDRPCLTPPARSSTGPRVP